MKSTMLAIVVTMVISALYSVQNMDYATIRFLMFEWSLRQYVWDIVLFCSGALMMCLFSFFANREVRNRYKRQIKELNEKLELMDRDKKELIASITSAKATQDAVSAASAETSTDAQSSSDAASAEEKV